jgi:hypothetical protein
LDEYHAPETHIRGRLPAVFLRSDLVRFEQIAQPSNLKQGRYHNRQQQKTTKGSQYLTPQPVISLVNAPG